MIKKRIIKNCTVNYKKFLIHGNIFEEDTKDARIEYYYCEESGKINLTPINKFIPVLKISHLCYDYLLYDLGKLQTGIVVSLTKLIEMNFFHKGLYFCWKKLPSQIFFDEFGQICSWFYMNKYNEKHNDKGAPACVYNLYNERCAEYYLNGEEYTKIDYFLKLAELQCK